MFYSVSRRYDGACNIGSIVDTARKTAILTEKEGGKHKRRDVVLLRIHLANTCHNEQTAFKGKHSKMERCEVKMSFAHTTETNNMKNTRNR